MLKYTQLFEADVDSKLNSGEKFSLSSVWSGDRCEFYFAVKGLRTVWLTGNQVPVVRSRSKCLLFGKTPDQHLDWDKGWHLTSLTCLPPRYTSLEKIPHFPDEAGNLSELQGVSHQGFRGLSVNTQSPAETQCYPHWPNCLHISVAFPDN